MTDKLRFHINKNLRTVGYTLDLLKRTGAFMRDQDLLGNVEADATEVVEEDITTIITMDIITIITMDTTIAITTTTTNTAEEC